MFLNYLIETFAGRTKIREGLHEARGMQFVHSCPRLTSGSRIASYILFCLDLFNNVLLLNVFRS